MQNADREGSPPVYLGAPGEPDTEKLVCPVRREASGNLSWQQEKALDVHPIGKDGLDPFSWNLGTKVWLGPERHPLNLLRPTPHYPVQ